MESPHSSPIKPTSATLFLLLGRKPVSYFRREFRDVDFVSCRCLGKVRVLGQNLPRVISRTVEVRHQGANDEEVLHFLRLHFVHGLFREGLVVHGAAAPRRLGFLFLPSIRTTEATVVVVAEALKVIERGHIEVGTRQRRRKFLADSIEHTNARQFLDAFGKNFLSPRGTLLRGGLVAGTSRVDLAEDRATILSFSPGTILKAQTCGSLNTNQGPIRVR